MSRGGDDQLAGGNNTAMLAAASDRALAPPGIPASTDERSSPVAGGDGSAPPAQPILWAEGLTKRYGHFTALDGCDLRVHRGEVFGLLGPNGAGKTTLIRLWMGFLKPTAGRAEICGLDCQRDSVAVRRQVGYLPAEARLPRHLRGRSVLEFFARMHPGGNLPRALELAELLELDLSRRVAFMSTGMRQKLGLCTVLSLDVPLLILDEPTANLDPTIRHHVLRLVADARAAGRTVIFSSHVLSETEEVCERVVFVRRGRIAFEQSMSDLRQRHRIIVSLPDGLPPRPTTIERTIEAQRRRNDEWQLDVAGDLSHVLQWLSHLPVQRMRIEPLGLRSVYEAVHRGDPSFHLDDEARP
jgi:ABC-2 type transport system ATP-binding protein